MKKLAGEPSRDWLARAGFKNGASDEVKHRLQVRFGSSTLHLIENTAAETGESRAEVVRTLVNAGLQEFEDVDDLRQEVSQNDN